MERLLDDQDLLRQQLTAIQSGTLEGVFTIDPQGVILGINEQAARLFQVEVDAIVGQEAHVLMPSAQAAEERAHLASSGISTLTLMSNRSQEVLGKRSDGTVFPIRLSVREISNGERTYYLCLVHDLTSYRKSQDLVIELHRQLRVQNEELERKVAQRTLQLQQSVADLALANKKLALEIREREIIAKNLQEREIQLERLLSKERELSELRSRFVSMASHEFRTPLTTMLSSVEIIEMATQQPPEILLKHSRRIREGIGYLRNVLEDFLQLGKLDVQGTDLHIQDVDLSRLFNVIVEELQLMCKPGQDIELTLSPQLGNTRHSVNGLRIVVTNLIGNAIKYSTDGSAIDVVVTTEGKQLQVKVSDEGMGIPEAALPYLFERFFRAGNAETTKGTGLGLHIVSRYVEAMGGTIDVLTAAGKGSTFTVNIPYRLEAESMSSN